MTNNMIYLRQYDWLLHVFFDVTPKDVYDVIVALEDAAISANIIRRSVSLMKKGEYNYGFTATNSIIKETIIVIGEHTSREDFLNTMQHEIRHLVDDIAINYGLVSNGEEVGYMTGTINTLLAQNINKYFCSCQHSDRQDSRQIILATE